MESIVTTASRVVVFDTLGTYWGRNVAPDGFVTVRDTSTLKAFLREHVALPFRVVYQPTRGNKAEQFEVVAYLVYKLGWCVFAVDEVDTFCDASRLSVVAKERQRQLLPHADQLEGGLYQLANYSRHDHIAFVGTSRRPAQVSRGLTSQCSELWVFRMSEPVDLDYMAKTMGPTTASQLQKLEPYTFLVYRDGFPSEVRGGFSAALS